MSEKQLPKSHILYLMRNAVTRNVSQTQAELNSLLQKTEEWLVDAAIIKERVRKLRKRYEEEHKRMGGKSLWRCDQVLDYLENGIDF